MIHVGIWLTHAQIVYNIHWQLQLRIIQIQIYTWLRILILWQATIQISQLSLQYPDIILVVCTLLTRHHRASPTIAAALLDRLSEKVWKWACKIYKLIGAHVPVVLLATFHADNKLLEVRCVNVVQIPVDFAITGKANVLHKVVEALVEVELYIVACIESVQRWFRA